MLLLVLVEMIGAIGGGSRRWLDLGFMILQPSELMKPAIILVLARFYDTLPATMTASWLIQMGWPEVVVLDNAFTGVTLESGTPGSDLPEAIGAGLQTILASELQASLEVGGVAVIDLATSLEYKAAHIPGAFWAVRARLDEALAKAPADATLVFTGSDLALARLTAADAVAAGRVVKLLEGGNGGWKKAGYTVATGFENLTTANNDVQYKAYDHDENIEFHMQEYLSWEIGLVDLVDKDSTARFRHIPA